MKNNISNKQNQYCNLKVITSFQLLEHGIGIALLAQNDVFR